MHSDANTEGFSLHLNKCDFQILVAIHWQSIFVLIYGLHTTNAIKAFLTFFLSTVFPWTVIDKISGALNGHSLQASLFSTKYGIIVNVCCIFSFCLVFFCKFVCFLRKIIYFSRSKSFLESLHLKQWHLRNWECNIVPL